MPQSNEAPRAPTESNTSDRKKRAERRADDDDPDVGRRPRAAFDAHDVLAGRVDSTTVAQAVEGWRR